MKERFGQKVKQKSTLALKWEIDRIENETWETIAGEKITQSETQKSIAAEKNGKLKGDRDVSSLSLSLSLSLSPFQGDKRKVLNHFVDLQTDRHTYSYNQFIFVSIMKYLKSKEPRQILQRVASLKTLKKRIVHLISVRMQIGCPNVFSFSVKYNYEPQFSSNNSARKYFSSFCREKLIKDTLNKQSLTSLWRVYCLWKRQALCAERERDILIIASRARNTFLIRFPISA